MNLNKVFILGNLTNDPLVRALPSGQSVVNFSVATNRFYTDKSGEKKQDTEFHNIVAFGRNAEIVQQYLKKGSMVLVEGRLQTRNWQDSSGIKKYKTEIIVEKLQLGPKNTSQPGFNPQKQAREETVIKENIPIIEEGKEEETPLDKESAAKLSNNNDKEEEIDVKKIPF